MNELHTLARELADEAARSDIESFCGWVGGEPIEGDAPWSSAEPDRRWYKTTDNGEQDAIVRRAVRYLDLRGLIERHPDNPDLVRFRKAENSGDGAYRT